MHTRLSIDPGSKSYDCCGTASDSEYTLTYGHSQEERARHARLNVYRIPGLVQRWGDIEDVERHGDDDKQGRLGE